MEKKKEKIKETDLKEMSEKHALEKPHISEKATALPESGFYVFKVKDGANKKDIKEETEKKYKVNVEKVRIIKVPPKKRRVGRTEGKTKGYKKAIVKIKKGQTIDLSA